jgi:hypothetical protein
MLNRCVAKLALGDCNALLFIMSRKGALKRILQAEFEKASEVHAGVSSDLRLSHLLKSKCCTCVISLPQVQEFAHAAAKTRCT